MWCIPKQILDASRTLSPALYPMCTGGGADYIAVSIDRCTDLILGDDLDSGSPGYDENGEIMEFSLSADAVVYLQQSSFDEPHAWNAGDTSPVLMRGSVLNCLRFMASVATHNNVNSEPDY